MKANVLVREPDSGSDLYGIQKDYEGWDLAGIGRTTIGNSAVGRGAVGKDSEGGWARKPIAPSAKMPTHKKKKESKKNKRAQKQHADPRYQQIVDHYLKRFEAVTGIKGTFDGADGKNLRALLARQATTPTEGIIRWLNHAFDSTDSYPL